MSARLTLNNIDSDIRAILATLPVIGTASVTGSVLVWNNTTHLWVPNANVLYGDVPAGLSTDYGLYTPGATDTFSIWSTRSSGPENRSIALVADVNSATIDAGHQIASLGWVNNADTYTGIGAFLGSGALSISSARNLGITTTSGITLANTTAAGAGAPAQQVSPALVLEGQGWKTDTGGASQSVQAYVDLLPVQGAAAPTGTIQWKFKVGSGALSASMMSLLSSGALSVVTLSTGGGAISCTSNAYLGQIIAGLGTTYGLGGGASVPLIVGSPRTDGVGNIVTAFVYDRNAATITNAATMRWSWGWTNDADVYGELASINCNGDFYNVGVHNIGKASNLGTTTTSGIMLFNSTPATVGAQQKSPAIQLSGQGWKTDATAASQSVDFYMDVLPVQGASAPTGALQIYPKIGTGAIGSAVTTVASTGALWTAKSVDVSAALNLLTTDVVGISAQNTTAATVGAQVQYSPIISSAGTAWNGTTSETQGWAKQVRPVAGTGSTSSALHFLWSNNGAAYSSIMSLTSAGEMAFAPGTGASVFGQSSDGAGAIGVILGSDVAYSTTGSKLLSIMNGGLAGTERAYFDYLGILNISSARALGVTSAYGSVLENSTAAAVGAQQVSPAAVFLGRGWETTVGTSQTVGAMIDVLPVQAAACTGTMQWKFKTSTAGVWSTPAMSLASTGVASAVGFSASNYMASPNFNAGSSVVLWANYPNNIGLGVTDQLYAATAARPLAFVHQTRTDGAGNICIVSGYLRGAAITNAATMRLHSFGVTLDAVPTYTELAAIYCDGTISGTSNVVASAGRAYMGNPPAGLSNDYGIYTPVVSDTLSLWSTRTTASGNQSIALVADVNNATLDTNHKVAAIGWVDNTDTYTELFNFKAGEIQSTETSSARMLGDEPDGGSVVAAIIGSEPYYSTAGSKLLSVINGTSGYERAYVDYLGNLCFNMGNNGQYLAINSITSEETIAAAAYTDTTVTIPAYSYVLAASSRVTVTIPTASGMTIGDNLGNATRFGWALSTAQGTTNAGTSGAGSYYHYATPVRVTPSSTPQQLGKLE
jgi:hypothetical protein